MNINHLAKLSRLELREEEKASLERELQSILNYVSELPTKLVEGYPMPEGTLSTSVDNVRQVQRQNIFREDIDPYPSGDFTEAIMAEVERKEDGYLVVKQIIAEK